MKRVFIAHPAGLTDDELLDTFNRVLACVLGEARDASAELVLGRDDFLQNAKNFGGWDGWATSVGAGFEYAGMTRRPRFDAIIVTPAQNVGKATASIVTAALSIGRPVFFLPSGGQIQAVRRVVRVDPKNFKTGWHIE